MDKTILTWIISGVLYLTAVIVLYVVLGDGSSMEHASTWRFGQH